MSIGGKERLATAVILAAIGIIAAAIGWSYAETQEANRQRQDASEIARGLTELRLVTFEYALSHNDRARAQWQSVSARIDRAIADSRFSSKVQQDIVGGLRERRTLAQRVFGEVSSVAASSAAPGSGAERQFEQQLFSRLLILQQNSINDAFHLTDLATQRIIEAQDTELLVILAGLALIAAIKIATSWMMNRGVLAPIVRLRESAHRVASGDRVFRFENHRDDEIGQLAQSLNTMTQSLQRSFAQLERGNGELAALNKELEAFSYSVSHDLRAPLRSMDGFSLALLQDYGDKLDDEGKDFLARIRAASQRMGRLIDDLLVLSRVTRVELKVAPVDLSALARQIAESLADGGTRRTVNWEIDGNVVLHADKALLERAMHNLLENAWKFTAKTANATIRVGMDEREAAKTVFVADNGVGFDMTHADKLFGAFQRLHHAADFPGTGIGLAIVQRIVRRHGGRIWAQARPGEGATFFFTVGENGNDAHRQDHPAG